MLKVKRTQLMYGVVHRIAILQVTPHGRVGSEDQQKHFSPLGNKLYFSANSAKKTPNITSLSSGCRTAIKDK